MYRLVNPIRRYAWGSRHAIAELQGRPAPTAEPEAELWMGAHPSAPSEVERDGRRIPLPELIDESPEELLGAAVLERFGPRLPFLLKVLAAAEPLSLQAHPDAEQARAGFEREERAGVGRDDPRRNYPDPHHKPELICALTPFEALCGFRPLPEALEVLARLSGPRLERHRRRLAADADATGLGRLVTTLLELGDAKREALVAEVADAARGAVAAAPPVAAAARTAAALAERYPGDIGVVLSLLLNHVRLEPGEGLYLGAGVLHSYLGGVGVEIMAASDNVLRGGCTVKHVDRTELLRTLRIEPGRIAPRRPGPRGPEDVWATPADELRLSAIDLEGGAEVALESPGPEILLCVEGEVTATAGEPDPAAAPGETLGRGDALFVPAAEGRYALVGEGRLFRATVGMLHA